MNIIPNFTSAILLLIAGCTFSSNKLDWQRQEGFHWAEVSLATSEKAGFEQLSPDYTGITFANNLSDKLIADNRVLLNGSGVAAGDINQDGLVDLYFTKLDGSNRLYLNKGNFQFEDITDLTGVAHKGYYSTGAVFADVNGNGHLDLLVTSVSGPNALYINEGNGHFQLKKKSGLDQAKGSMTMALADINQDRYLDLYITNYREKVVKDIYPMNQLTFENITSSDSLLSPYDQYYTMVGEPGNRRPRELGLQDELYINEGDGTFRKVTDLEQRFLNENGEPQGLFKGWGLTAKFHDLNRDGLPDLYIANDFWTPDRIWINQGKGVFKEVDNLAIRNSSYSSMAVDFSDINRDGFKDIFTTEMLGIAHSSRLRQVKSKEPLSLQTHGFDIRPRYNRNSLYINRGDDTYAETSWYSGLQASDWSWGTKFLDVNLDGYEDILVNTGFRFDLQDMDSQMKVLEGVRRKKLSFESYILAYPMLEQQNRIFKNNRDLTFTEVGSSWGFKEEDISHGLASADLNNDGALDIIVNRMNAVSTIFKNKTSKPRIAVRLVGKSPNTQAIGAKVTLTGYEVKQTKEITAGGDYLSGSDPMVMFAADRENPNHQLAITWPDGKVSKIDSVKANRIYKIFQDSIRSTNPQIKKGEKVSSPISSYFKDVSHLISHEHHEDRFGESRLQPLLPNKLDQFGPGTAWIDINQNGYQDLVIGAGQGGKLAIFENKEDGKFASLTMGELTKTASYDQTTVVGWNAKNATHIIVGYSNLESRNSDLPSAIHYTTKNGRLISVDKLPGFESVTGPLAASDYNNDGDIDLFVGGHYISGQYPRDASSRLFKMEDNTFKIDEENSASLKNIGLVKAAVFVDYNLDGFQDLVMAAKWGNIQVFENQKGVFRNRTKELRLEQWKGRWNGIATGDFNNDGYPDLVATNWGENSAYQIHSTEYPFKLYYDDLDGYGGIDVIEAVYDTLQNAYVPFRQFHEYKTIQKYFRNVRSYRSFSKMSLKELIGPHLNYMAEKEANTFKSMVFLNEGGRLFTAQSLPPKAQFSTAFAPIVGDMNSDGFEDIFLSQNFFAVTNPQVYARNDAGRGLWLQGNGQGDFEAVPGHISGVKVYGEQRGAALADFNKDGKVDLVVTQNDTSTKLYQNQIDRRGLRIRLIGSSQNTDAIGSSVRVIYDNGTKGPRRTIQAGSGFWSQNSSVQILGFKKMPEQIEVKWYDGHVQYFDVQEQKMDYTFTHTHDSE